MYQIGEFSRITGIAVKTLRYYDEAGLLAPSERSEGGYRLYSETDFVRAERIVLLRQLSFSIAEIRDVLDRCADEEELQYVLREKREQIARQIHREKALLRSIDRRLTHIQKQEEHLMHYEVTIQTIPGQLAATIRYCGGYDCGPYMGPLYKAAGNRAAGAPFHLCYDGEYVEEGDMEICVPLTAAVAARGCTVREIPGCRALTTVHRGPYDAMGHAYKALLDYAREQGLALALPHRLIYRKGPGMLFKGNPEKYETEIVVPIAEE